jgi:hypothetical protein
MTACVVPVGPKWSDPVPGTPPYIGSANPPVGSALGPGQDSDIGPPVQVEVNLADQDTGDVIFLRWIIDYPPYSGATRGALEVSQPGGGSVVRGGEVFAPDCANVSPTTSSHQLMLAASTQVFVTALDSATPDAVTDPSTRVEAIWPFVLNCP